MYKAGQDLAGLVHGDPKNPRVWFAIQRALPDRWQTKDPVTGKWIPLRKPARKPRVEKELVEATPEVAATTTPLQSDVMALKDKSGAVAAVGTHHAILPKGSSVKTTTKSLPSKSKHSKGAPKKRSPKVATKTSRSA
jgi:hypothetical protein